MDSKRDRIKVAAGDVLHFDTWGGGGWGKPYERDPEIVAMDVDRGLVTLEGARRYGVVMTDTRTVDESATEELRAQMRATDSGSNEIFNRGGTIDELKRRCEAETGLPAPAQPQFQIRI